MVLQQPHGSEGWGPGLEPHAKQAVTELPPLVGCMAAAAPVDEGLHNVGLPPEWQQRT